MLERDGKISDKTKNMNKLIKLAKQIYSSDNIGYVMIFADGTLWGTIGIFVKLLNGVGASPTLRKNLIS